MPAGRIQLIAPARRQYKSRSKKGSSLSSVKREVKSLKKFVMKTIENKQSLYSNGLGDDVDSTGFEGRPQTLLLTQGTADGSDRPNSARIGNSITLLRESVNMQVEAEPSSTGVTKMRVMVVSSVDGNENIDIDEVLQYAQVNGVDGLDNGMYTSHYTTKTDTNKRYRIHFDKQYVLGVHTDTSGMVRPCVQNIKCRIKYGKTGKVVEYNGTNNTPVNHNLQILAFSNRAAVNAPILSYQIKSVYKDA